jgi:hypothetical protein
MDISSLGRFSHGIYSNHRFALARRALGAPTATALDKGRWDYAPIVLPTPNGFIYTIGMFIDSKYLLVEGHQRRRYLNALVHRGVVLEPQRVILLDTDFGH